MNELAEEQRDLRPGITRPYGVEGANLKEAEEKAAHAKEWERAQELRRQRQRIDQREAEEILDGQGTGAPDSMLGLAKRLAEYKRFGLARRILDGVRPRIRRTDFPKIYVQIFQKSALYTYKDVDLPADWRLDRALDILGQAEDLARTEDHETLGLAGAIHKRKWEVDAQRRSLETAFYFYLRGYAMGLRDEHVASPAGVDRKEALHRLRQDVLGYLRANPECRLSAAEDQGYCGINAAFVLDLMAAEEEREARRVGVASPAAETKRLDANLIRAEITRSLPPLVEVDREDAPTSWMKRAWWVYATLGEAYFGLGADDPKNYAKALEWLEEKPGAAGLRVGLRRASPAAFVVPEWEYESSARQLARLALLRVGSSRVDLQACKLEYSIVSPK